MGYGMMASIHRPAWSPIIEGGGMINTPIRFVLSQLTFSGNSPEQEQAAVE